MKEIVNVTYDCDKDSYLGKIKDTHFIECTFKGYSFRGETFINFRFTYCTIPRTVFYPFAMKMNVLNI